MRGIKHVVLLKSRSGGQGGLEKYTSRIAKGFLEKGASLTLLTTTKSSLALDPSIASVQFETLSWPAFWRLEQFDRSVSHWLKDHPADIVFGMDRNRIQTHLRAGNGVHAAYLKSRTLMEGRLKTWSFKINPLHRKILELEKCAFENPSLQTLFTNSEMVKREILEHYRTDPAKIEVVHNGVEWKEMAPGFEAWETGKKKACERWGLNPHSYHFLFIGNGFLRKGVKVLLQALSTFPLEDFHLSIVGKDNQMEAFQTLAKRLGLKHKVRFFGPQKESLPFYQLADALAIPSFYDPFANVTVEALAMGLFVISSKHNGGHEILTAQTGALIEDLLDLDSVKTALQVALSRRKTKGSASTIRASAAPYDFSHQLKRLIDACG